MINWRELPFVRLFVPFALGIAAAWQLDQNWTWLNPLILLLFSLLIGLGTLRLAFAQRWLYGCLLYLLLFFFGYQHCFHHDERRQPQHLQSQQTKDQILLVQIDNQPQLRKTLQTRGRVLAWRNPQHDWQACQGQILLYLAIKAQATDLRYGDQILLRAPTRPIPAARNPKAFDYQRYQKGHNVHYQSYARAEQWEIVARTQGQPLLALAHQWRQHLLNQLTSYLGSTDEKAVASALLLGQRGEIGSDLKSAYANTGATHVLAVSGLHVGFVYLGLAFLLGFIPFRAKSWRLIRTALLLMGVWGFALLTGASPSVLRASTMFSFIIIGRALYRPTNIYNTLAISACLLLIYDPYLLFEVGFQLSYLAVLGIVSFQAWIYRWWIIDHPIGDYIWKLSSVSLAAQLTTFPLCVYYFHQFPLYFWLSGLVVVPAAMLVLGLGVLFFLTAALWPGLAKGIALVLYSILWLMNALIYAIEQLPVAVIEGLWIGEIGLGLLYLAVVANAYLFWRNHRRRWSVAGGLAICLVLAVLGQSWQRSEQRQMIIYSVAQHTLVDLVDGFARWRIGSEKVEEKQESFAAQNYRWKLGAAARGSFNLAEDDQSTEFGWYHQGYGQFYQHSFVLLDRLPIRKPTQLLPVKVLLLRADADLELAQLGDYFEFEYLLADASNRPRTIARWKKQAEALALPFVDIRGRGGQIIHLSQTNLQ